MQVSLESPATAEYYAEGPVGYLFGRRFDMGTFAWRANALPSCEYYLGSQIPTEENDWSGVNVTGFDYAPYNEQCTQAITTLPGSEEYIEAHMEAQRIFAEELPSLPLFLNLKLAGIRTNVRGFDMDPSEATEMWNIEAFDLDR